MEFAHDSTTTAESDVSVTTSESMMLSPGRIQDVEEGGVDETLGLEVRRMRKDWRDEIYCTYSKKKVVEEEMRKERELLEVKKSQEEKKKNWNPSAMVSWLDRTVENKEEEIRAWILRIKRKKMRTRYDIIWFTVTDT